ncbi:hypothetical protein [Aeromonas hydrophila]|uniref:hypothetical protein n=1 Tax=Aeromonas hydrophila TaxID=644 RepID=UPI00126A11C6|nr:hypothetical protein [Aeromonas hydrophila]
MSSDVSSIGSSSLSASYNNAASSASAQPAKHHHYHDREGGGDKMMGDVKSALSSLGVNVDTSNSDTKSALSSFMHNLMGAVRGASGKEDGNDNDGDESGQAQAVSLQSSSGSNSMKQGLDTLISALSNGNSSDPVLNTLQDQFNSIVGSSAGQNGNKVSLQDFLSSLESKLPQESPGSGYMVDTTA